MKLNLGAGNQKVSGFIGIDLSGEADVKHDLRDKLPYEDDSVEEILAIHVIESFYKWEFPRILSDWYRVLQKDGRITIEFTILSEAINMYRSQDFLTQRSGRWGLYGNQDKEVDPIVLHHYVYEKDEIMELLNKTGFTKIGFDYININHIVGRDVRVVAWK